jgi:mono/diheme cytochrome c family protein
VIATAAFVLGFLVIGLAVVFVALGGGPRGARQNLHPRSRGGNSAVFGISLAVIVAFGVGIPIAVIAANSDNQSKQAPGGVKLTASQQSGRKVFATNCSTCHTLKAANAVGKVGPSLDQIRPPAALTLNAVKLGRARGQGQMPAGLVDGQDAKNVASFVAATAGHD